MNQTLTLFDTPVAEPKTQNGQLLKWLRGGHTITSFEAYTKFGITQLAARIRELEDKGHVFNRPRITLPSGKKVCRYSLVNAKGD